jgi:hypothetical protein
VSARDYDTVAQRLVQVVPEFSGVVEEHRTDNDEILPHVLYGDLTRFVVAAAKGGTMSWSGEYWPFLRTNSQMVTRR